MVSGLVDWIETESWLDGWMAGWLDGWMAGGRRRAVAAHPPTPRSGGRPPVLSTQPHDPPNTEPPLSPEASVARHDHGGFARDWIAGAPRPAGQGRRDGRGSSEGQRQRGGGKGGLSEEHLGW